MKWLAAGAGLIILLASGYFGLTKLFGAHPWWAFKVTWIGAPLGCLVFLFLAERTRSTTLFALALVLTGMAFWLAHWGKTEFAASYAENAFAGRVWYFGWIATAGFAGATVASIVLILTARKHTM